MSIKGVAVVVAVLVFVCMGVIGPTASAAPEGQMPVVNPAIEGTTSPLGTAALAISAAFVVAMSCLAAGFAVARVGSAALGAASERPELLGRSLIFVAIGEGIAILGLVMGIMLLRKITT